MQRLIQRTQHAERIAARRASKQQRASDEADKWARRQTRIRQNEALLRTFREARVNRKIDWDAGPLAPRRDAGDKMTTFGALHIYNAQPPEVDKDKRPRWLHIVEQDRVVVVRGRDRGRIGVVDEVDSKKATVRIKGINEADIHLPEWLREEQQLSSQETITVNKNIPYSDVKLVYALPDPQSGEYRDVVIDRLVCVNRKFNIHTREWDSGNRVIAGTNTAIPWPAKPEESFDDNVADTLRMSVEERTFQPPLLYSPMPLSVIDELRNKYSKFRTRHDPEYVEKKQMEDARAEKRRSLTKTMRTPLQELAELRSKAKKDPELTDEQLAKIGEVIAQEQAKAKNTISDGQR